MGSEMCIRDSVWVSLKTNTQVSRTEVLAVFPVDGRALRGRGGRTLLGCRSEVVLYTPLVIIASRRHMDLAMVAVLGWDHPSHGMVVWFVHEYFLSRLEHGVRSKFAVIFCLSVCTLGQVSACELKSGLRNVPRILCEFFAICCSSFMKNPENCIY